VFAQSYQRRTREETKGLGARTYCVVYMRAIQTYEYKAVNRDKGTSGASFQLARQIVERPGSSISTSPPCGARSGTTSR
jgi:hypothetical protein